jgi:hypothetical protein
MPQLAADKGLRLSFRWRTARVRSRTSSCVLTTDIDGPAGLDAAEATAKKKTLFRARRRRSDCRQGCVQCKVGVRMIQAHQRWKLGNVLFRRARCGVIRRRRTEDGERSKGGEQEEKATVHDTVTLGAPSGAKSAPQWVLVASELETLKPLCSHRAGLLNKDVYFVATQHVQHIFYTCTVASQPSSARSNQNAQADGACGAESPFASASAAGDAGSSVAAGLNVSSTSGSASADGGDTRVVMLGAAGAGAGARGASRPRDCRLAALRPRSGSSSDADARGAGTRAVLSPAQPPRAAGRACARTRRPLPAGDATPAPHDDAMTTPDGDATRAPGGERRSLMRRAAPSSSRLRPRRRRRAR